MSLNNFILIHPVMLYGVETKYYSQTPKSCQ